ncbi:MAG: Polypeptide N-acetylgalactosaminyltransferase 5 [Actinomycetia bacterium]|nr:Polypeptide N-acetylgalactosaminyltransferase 5 [Actinomycetes bacterium]
MVDNASGDGSADLARHLRPDAKIVKTGENCGYAAGVNAGIATSTGRRAVLVCNPDVRLGHSAIPSLLAALARPGAGISAPRTTRPDGQLVYSLRRDATVRRVLGEAVLGGTRACRVASLSQVVGDRREYESSHPVAWAAGSVLMCSRACLDAVGPWDESFFMYAEEVDFQMRAREHGFSVWYTPDATAVHVGGDLHRSRQLWALQMRNRVRLFARRHNRLHTAGFRAACVLNEVIRIPVGGGIHRAGLQALLGPLDEGIEIEGPSAAIRP